MQIQQHFSECKSYLRERERERMREKERDKGRELGIFHANQISKCLDPHLN